MLDKKNIKYKRVSNKDVRLIILLFKKVFKKNIYKFNYNYYKNYYFFNNKYNSFIAYTDSGEIIGHVAYKYTFYNIGNKKYKLALRFSSMVTSKYRNIGIYKNLLYFSFNYLIKDNVKGIICWPNKKNLTGCIKHRSFSFIKKINTYSYKFRGSFEIKNFLSKKNIFRCSLKNYKKLKNLNLIYSNKENFEINKNKLYIKKRYFLNDKRKYYFYFTKKNNYNNVIFFSTDVIKSKNYINLLDYFYSKNYVNEDYFLKSFFDDLKKYKLIIRIWKNLINFQNKNLIFNIEFFRSNLVFNLGYYNLDNNKSQLSKILKSYNYTMGDNDVF